jgi:hypothetical protein
MARVYLPSQAYCALCVASQMAKAVLAGDQSAFAFPNTSLCKYRLFPLMLHVRTNLLPQTSCYICSDTVTSVRILLHRFGYCCICSDTSFRTNVPPQTTCYICSDAVTSVRILLHLFGYCCICSDTSFRTNVPPQTTCCICSDTVTSVQIPPSGRMCRDRLHVASVQILLHLFRYTYICSDTSFRANAPPQTSSYI